MKNLAIVIVLTVMMTGSVIAKENGKAITPGEYRLLFSQPTDSKLVKKAFREFGVVYVLSLGQNVYLMRLDDDPGRSKAEHIARTLPNFKKISVNSVYKLK